MYDKVIKISFSISDFLFDTFTQFIKYYFNYLSRK